MYQFNQLMKGYLQKKVFIFFMLGLSCGVPLNLLAGTLSLWATEVGVNLTQIGLFALVLVPYSFKFLWAPFVDKVRIPVLSRIGRKKAWGVIFQIGLFFCLCQVAFLNPATQITQLFFWCFLAAFFAASQDIVVDALRIDTLEGDSLKEGSAIYQFGYRIGMLATGAGVIALSTIVPWSVCYTVSAFLIAWGLYALLMVKEPAPKVAAVPSFDDLAVRPFVDFMTRHSGWLAILGFIVLYKICNAILGRMALPFYADIGFTKEQIAVISSTIGPWITMAGVFFGGLLMVRIGFLKSLFYLGFVEILTSLSFAVLAMIGNSVPLFFAVIVFDNIVGGMGGAVFVGYLSSLCSRAYSGTQYALLTSLMMIATSTIASSSGWLAQQLGWVWFFVATGIMMIPALILLGVMRKKMLN